ncbi:MAG: DUF2225 domain-containing protein [Rubrobacter sp.]
MGRVRQPVRCPVCDHFFTANVVRLGVTVGRGSDLCPHFRGRAVDGARRMRSEITVCPECLFAARESFSDLDFSPVTRHDIEERISEDGLLKVFRASDPPWFPFHAAEVSGKGRGLPARELGELCLRGSWVCRKENEKPFESAFQTRAIRHYIRALDADDLSDRNLSVTTYLIGELSRRLGQHREALNWYVNAEKTLEESQPEGLTWLERMIEEQSRLAKEEAEAA